MRFRRFWYVLSGRCCDRLRCEIEYDVVVGCCEVGVIKLGVGRRLFLAIVSVLVVCDGLRNGGVCVSLCNECMCVGLRDKGV